ncbi:MAG: hypothetical protein GY796_17120 [Chloroflexi bacterium]|nr:hypothetical protein [Chloroflexota bacterium]
MDQGLLVTAGVPAIGFAALVPPDGGNHCWLETSFATLFRIMAADVDGRFVALFACFTLNVGMVIV